MSWYQLLMMSLEHCLIDCEYVQTKGRTLSSPPVFTFESIWFLCVEDHDPKLFKFLAEVCPKDGISLGVHTLSNWYYTEVCHSRVVVLWAEMVLNETEVRGIALSVNAVVVFPEPLLKRC